VRIAQVSPLHESVPPGRYGGTERVVAYLTEELLRRGHEVTLFASGDSHAGVPLVAACRRSLRTDPHCRDTLPHHVVQLEQVAQRARAFDVIHFHTEAIHLPLARALDLPALTTVHGRLDSPELGALYREFGDAPLVSISYAQRAPLPFANWAGNVYHGLPPGLYTPRYGAGDYLAFVGRLSPEKGVAEAIAIARATRLPLKIAAKIDAANLDYFETRIRPQLSDPLIEFVGEIDDSGKSRFLGEARALLFPIDWPEPFGLVMIEALACGTPVIARRRGSVPELCIDGVTGFVFETMAEAVSAVGRIGTLDRRVCRRHFEERFAAGRMADEYLAIYELVQRRRNDVGEEPIELRRAAAS
jgi:glycosyltransferase involved in cell wall biosynthesis